MKILSLANDIASRNNANGKTICNYLDSNYQNYDVFSFYINGKKENGENYFFVSDEDALYYFKTLGKRKNNEQITNKSTQNIKSHKTALKHLLRYYIWNSGLWKKSGFDLWINSFKPDLILLLLGDNIYLIKLAIQISKKFNVPIHVLIGENYCFKHHNYIERKTKPGFVYTFFRHKLSKITIKCCRRAEKTIFNSNDLCTLYSKNFNLKNSIVNIPSSQLTIQQTAEVNKNKVLYAGNLGINRDKSLNIIAKVLEKINPEIKFFIYGNGEPNTIEKLKTNKNIIYGGYISNDLLIKEIETSRLLVHCESFDSYDIMDLEYAFSTKIADFLASRKKFIVYAPSQLVETKFLVSIVPQMVATNKNDLEIKLRQLLEE